MSCLNAEGCQTLAISRHRKRFSQAVTLQHKLYHKMQVGCEGLTGIQHTVVLWKGGDSSDEQVNACNMEFCSTHIVLLPFENVCIMMYNKESV